MQLMPTSVPATKYMMKAIIILNAPNFIFVVSWFHLNQSSLKSIKHRNVWNFDSSFICLFLRELFWFKIEHQITNWCYVNNYKVTSYNDTSFNDTSYNDNSYKVTSYKDSYKHKIPIDTSYLPLTVINDTI